jgi:hypothetical protein
VRPAVIQNTLNTKSKIGIIMLIIVMIACTVLFSVLFINCFRFYSEFDIGYDELFYEELTFEKYEIIEKLKGGDIYEIYFKEYSEPFNISNIVTSAIDKNALARLKPGEKADVYYRDTSNRNYNYTICEMTCGASQILSLRNTWRRIKIIRPLECFLPDRYSLRLGGILVFIIVADGHRTRTFKDPISVQR